MSLRKLAGLAAGFALAVGLIGAGVSASFTDSVTAKENINVGTFSCGITTATTGATYGAIDALGYAHSVSYTAPTIMSSAAGTAPFFFTVKNTGSIADVLTVSTSPVSSPWSIIGAPFTAVPLSAGASTTYNTGVSWTALDNSNLGQTGTITWTVNCGENGPTVIFDNSPANAAAFYSPNLYYSESLGAQSQSQFGTQVGFAGSARKIQTVTVAMSDWACQTGSWNDGTCLTTSGATFPVAITFNVYAVGTGNAVGGSVATKTQTFAIPYRPSADVSCPKTGSQTAVGAAFRDPAGHCQNGSVSEITFTFAGETVPNSAIFGIAYAPTGDAGSLNVMLYPSDADTPIAAQPAVGSFPLPSEIYADHTSGTTFPFQLDTADDYSGIQPAVQFTATN
jgi:predicted ribosomally synthesized peptide with SipW-like signal peptide